VWWSYWVCHPDSAGESLHCQANLAVITLRDIIHILFYFSKANHEGGLSLSLCGITWSGVSLNNIVRFNWSTLAYVLFLPSHSRIIVTDSRTRNVSGSVKYYIYLTNCTRITMIHNNVHFCVYTLLVTASLSYKLLFLSWVWNLVFGTKARIYWGCLRTGYWGDYLGLNSNNSSLYKVTDRCFS
jgi:hypothetical protein